MYAEIINNKIVQSVENNAEVLLHNGTRYPEFWPKNEIPGLTPVIDPGRPDPEKFLVTRREVILSDDIPTLVYATEVIVPQPPPSPWIASVKELLDLMVGQAKRDCSQAIEALWPDFKQRNAALGIYGEAGLKACTQHIAACRSLCDEHEGALMALAEIEDREGLLAYLGKNFPDIDKFN